MRLHLFAFRLLASVVPFLAAGAATPNVMEPGLWEVTIETHRGVVVSTLTDRICISKAQAEQVGPPRLKKNSDCQVTGALTGSLLKYEVKCGKNGASSEAQLTYSGDHYEGSITYKGGDFGEIRQMYSARRLGQCEKDTE